MHSEQKGYNHSFAVLAGEACEANLNMFHARRTASLGDRFPVAGHYKAARNESGPDIKDMLRANDSLRIILNPLDGAGLEGLHDQTNGTAVFTAPHPSFVLRDMSTGP
jgi:hypothetical protein